VKFPIPFTKMSGAGNDFIIIDNREQLITHGEMSRFARLVCRRRLSVGADGLVLLENSPSADFRWQFLNADGSLAEMCGNASRCAARFAHHRGIAGPEMVFETLAGRISARVNGMEVDVRMTDPLDFRLNIPIEEAGDIDCCHFVNTGVPHVVLFVDDPAATDVEATGRLLRYHREFMPAGTNVNFVHSLADGRLAVRTYERGVEAETLACGTGCVAAALVGSALGIVTSPVETLPISGDRLTIRFDLREGPAAENVHMQGPAHEIYQGELTTEAIIENADTYKVN